MKKQVPFRREKIAICRNCHGTGRVSGYDTLTMCDVCNGSGRVRLTYEGVVNIEPYNEVKEVDPDPYEGCFP